MVTAMSHFYGTLDAIATIFRARRAIGNGLLLLDSLVGDFADMLEADNPRFDREQFIADCEADVTETGKLVGLFGRQYK